MQFRALGISVLAGVSLSGNVNAYCFEPTAPTAQFSFSRLSVPYCLSSYSYSGQHTCEQWEIDSYISEVEAFQRELNSYLDEVRAFAADAGDYARCELNEVKEESGIFQ